MTIPFNQSIFYLLSYNFKQKCDNNSIYYKRHGINKLFYQPGNDLSKTLVKNIMIIIYSVHLNLWTL